MSTLILLPAVKDPSREKASGGSISNNRLILKSAEHERVIVAPILNSLIPKDLAKHPNIDVLQPTSKKTGRIHYILSRYFIYPRHLQRIIKSRKPNQIIATRAAIPLAYRAALRASLRLKIITRAFEDHEQAGVRKASDKNTVFRYIEGILNRHLITQAYRNADCIIVNSRFMEKTTREAFDTRANFEIWYPEIDLPINFPKGSPIRVVGFVNKGSRKGAYLIEKIAKRMPHLEFRVFGSHHDGESELHNLANHGYINDRIDLFNKADLFLMPSVWDEPYGRVAAESIWRGIPVLVSKRGGLPEAAPSSFFWVEDESLECWEKNILKLNENPRETTEKVLEAQTELARRQSMSSPE